MLVSCLILSIKIFNSVSSFANPKQYGKRSLESTMKSISSKELDKWWIQVSVSVCLCVFGFKSFSLFVWTPEFFFKNQLQYLYELQIGLINWTVFSRFKGDFLGEFEETNEMECKWSTPYDLSNSVILFRTDLCKWLNMILFVHPLKINTDWIWITRIFIYTH